MNVLPGWLLPVKSGCILWWYLPVLLLVCGCQQEATQQNNSDAAIELLTIQADSGYQQVDGPRKFKFPADHGVHPGFRTEWWYVTGNVSDSERDFGYQLTFFRYLIDPLENADADWESDAVWLAQVALTDIDNEQFLTSEQLVRELPGLNDAASDAMLVQVSGWSLTQPDANQDSYQLDVKTASFSLKLQLDSIKPTVLQGDQGLSIKSADNPANASYYYSQTRLQTHGTLTLRGQSFEVQGSSWLDREWSTSALGARQSGWDWFALQLDNNHELMFYQLRLAGGGIDSASAGVWVRADGEVIHWQHSDVVIEAVKHWRSPHNNSRYPVGWTLSIPALHLDVEIQAVFPEQQWRGQFTYWEGAVTVSGKLRQQAVTGRGYVELTGY